MNTKTNPYKNRIQPSTPKFNIAWKECGWTADMYKYVGLSKKLQNFAHSTDSVNTVHYI